MAKARDRLSAGERREANRSLAWDKHLTGTIAKFTELSILNLEPGTLLLVAFHLIGIGKN
jgi:hypothetical protein